MKQNLLEQAARFIKSQRNRQRWYKAFSVMAVVVVFVTTYALILPAITMERPVSCGMEAHVHTADCYTRTADGYACMADLQLHTHDDACYDEEGDLVCGYADFVLHTHNEFCYDADGNLVCPLDEVTSYTVEQPVLAEEETDDVATGSALAFIMEKLHGDTVEYTEPHAHSEECYDEDGRLICGQLEVQAHQHDATCLADDALICGLEEHQHTDACYADEDATEQQPDADTEYICGLEAHTHSDACYDENGELICGLEEHQHSEACSSVSEEQPPDAEPADTESGAEAEPGGSTAEQSPDEAAEYLCDLEEHSHTATCYNEDDEQICALPEHTHSEACGTIAENQTPLPAVELEETVYHYEDSCISVTAVPENPDALPKNAELKVTKVDAEVSGYNYDAYMRALNNSTGEEEAYTADNTLLYDIAFFAGPEGEAPSDGQETLEYQPAAGQVSVSFTFKDGQLSESGSGEETDIQVIHLPLDETVREQVTATYEATDICADNVEVEAVAAQVTDQEVTFQLDNFSLVAFVTNDGTQIPITDVEPGMARTYQDILGDAVNYGITANTVSKLSHMDSNFAGSTVTTNGGNVTIGQYTNENRGGSFIIGNVDSGTLQIDGYTSAVFTTEEAGVFLTLKNGSYFVYDEQSHLNQLVSDMIEYAKVQSDAMFAERSYNVLTYGTYWNGSENVTGWYSDQNEKTLDISGYSAGTYYINGDDFLLKDDVKIKKKSDQTVVFNLSGIDVTLKRFEITNVDKNQTISSATSDSSVEPFAKTVIFNMPNANSVNIQSAIAGVLIAPGAMVEINSTSSGWIVANEVTNPGGEWHFVSQDVPESTAIVGIYAKKTVDGKAPEDGQKFMFALESWNGSEWTDQRTVENQAGNICFQNRYETVGTWYYRLSEVAGADAVYRYDETKYIIKIDIEAAENGAGLAANLTYYKASAIADCTSNMIIQAKDLTFNNVTSGDYTLPQTGGPGTTGYILAGLLLLAAAMLLYKQKQRGRAEL